MLGNTKENSGEKVSCSNSAQNLPKTEPACLHVGIKLSVLHNDTRENG